MIEEKPNKKIQKLLIEAANHHKNNHLEDLEKVLRKIILINSNYFPAFFNLARLFEMSKKFEEVVSANFLGSIFFILAKKFTV